MNTKDNMEIIKIIDSTSISIGVKELDEIVWEYHDDFLKAYQLNQNFNKIPNQVKYWKGELYLVLSNRVCKIDKNNKIITLMECNANDIFFSDLLNEVFICEFRKTKVKVYLLRSKKILEFTNKPEGLSAFCTQKQDPIRYFDIIDCQLSGETKKGTYVIYGFDYHTIWKIDRNLNAMKQYTDKVVSFDVNDIHITLWKNNIIEIGNIEKSSSLISERQYYIGLGNLHIDYPKIYFLDSSTRNSNWHVVVANVCTTKLGVTFGDVTHAKNPIHQIMYNDDNDTIVFNRIKIKHDWIIINK